MEKVQANFENIIDDEISGRWPVYQAEIRRWLSFIKRESQMARYQQRMQSRNWQDYLAEISTAYFLVNKKKLRIVEWEPSNEEGKFGEFIIKNLNAQKIFCSVKRPSWKRAIIDQEGISPRLKQNKFIHNEAWFSTTLEDIRCCINGAMEQLHKTIPNLLIINDDLRDSPLELPNVIENALFEDHGIYGKEVGYFANDQHGLVSGILFLNIVSQGRKMVYKYDYRGSPFAINKILTPFLSKSFLNFIYQSLQRVTWLDSSSILKIRAGTVAPRILVRQSENFHEAQSRLAGAGQAVRREQAKTGSAAVENSYLRDSHLKKLNGGHPALSDRRVPRLLRGIAPSA